VHRAVAEPEQVTGRQAGPGLLVDADGRPVLAPPTWTATSGTGGSSALSASAASS